MGMASFVAKAAKSHAKAAKSRAGGKFREGRPEGLTANTSSQRREEVRTATGGSNSSLHLSD